MFCPAPGFSYCSVLPLSQGLVSVGSQPLPFSNLPQLCTPAPHTPPTRFHSTRVSFWKPPRKGSGSHTPALPSHKDRYHVPREGGGGSFGGGVRKTLPIPAGVPESLIVTGSQGRPLPQSTSDCYPPTTQMFGALWFHAYAPAATFQCPQCEASRHCPGPPLSCLDLSSNL